jgi:hypothetical protein
MDWSSSESCAADTKGSSTRAAVPASEGKCMHERWTENSIYHIWYLTWQNWWISYMISFTVYVISQIQEASSIGSQWIMELEVRYLHSIHLSWSAISNIGCIFVQDWQIFGLKSYMTSYMMSYFYCDVIQWYHICNMVSYDIISYHIWYHKTNMIS